VRESVDLTPFPKKGNFIVQVETTLQVKDLLAFAFLSDGSSVYISILASILHTATVKGVIDSVGLFCGRNGKLL